jgi:polyphosphate kinase 2 (PPK2 family)
MTRRKSKKEFSGMPKQPLIPPFDKKVDLKDYDPAYTAGFDDEQDVQEHLEKDLERLSALQEILYAGAQQSVLIVVQAMDTGGKDGLIKHVFRGLNPAGVQVTSFKQPTDEELESTISSGASTNMCRAGA